MDSEVEGGECVLGGFLWAASMDYWEDILHIIEEKYPIIYVKKYKFDSTESLGKMIFHLYKNDQIPMKKVKKVKIKSLKELPPICINFFIRVDNPAYTLYRNQYVIKDVIDMKNDIRKQFRELIPNYKHDIILHISDNSEQTEYIHTLIEKYIRKNV